MKNLNSGIKVYSVEEITTYIKNLIESNSILEEIWVKGEISNFRNSEGNLYFSLKDENSIIDCAMFRRANKNLEFAPTNGARVIVMGGIEVYKKKGKFQIVVEEIQPLGEGKLFLKFLQLKEKLEKEGLFKEEFKKPIPKFPKTIGIVTSLNGAAIRDIIKTVKRRYPYVKLLIFPSLVQGDEAKYTIAKGIECLNKTDAEVIILARGGGTFEDLWPFNEEIVARAIFNSKVPVITGIGHEIDFTIADFVADKRAHTPSAAAELAVPDEKEIFNALANLENRLYKNLIKTLDYYKQQMYYLAGNRIFRKPFILVEEYKQLLDEKTTNLKQITLNKIEILKIKLEKSEGKLNALNPSAILNRGYSITLKKDKIIYSIKNINKGDIISTIVKDGKIESKIKNKNERNEREII